MKEKKWKQNVVCEIFLLLSVNLLNKKMKSLFGKGFWLRFNCLERSPVINLYIVISHRRIVWDIKRSSRIEKCVN